MHQRDACRLVVWLVSDLVSWRTAWRMKLAQVLPSPCSLIEHPAVSLVALLPLEPPHVVFWDRQSQEWIDGMRSLARSSPDCVQIVIADSWTLAEKTMANALGAGHCVTPDECLGSLHALLRTENPRHARKAAIATDDVLAMLTPREQQIIDALQHGLDNKSIARLMGISPATVKTHLHHVFDKLGTTRTQLLLHRR